MKLGLLSGGAWILCLLQLPPSEVLGLDTTVTGCDEYPCSVGSPETHPITNLTDARRLAQCHVLCLNKVRIPSLATWQLILLCTWM